MPRDLTDTQEMFLVYMEQGLPLKEVASKMDISMSYVYEMSSSLKEVIQERTRDRLTLAGMQSANTVIASLSADGSTEKGELRLKAAEAILDRIGVTKHTNVDVQIEAQNGIFILPGKSVVPPNQTEEKEEDTPEDT